MGILKCYKEILEIYFQLEIKDIESSIWKFNLLNREYMNYHQSLIILIKK